MLPVIYLMSGGTLGGMVMAEKDCESYPNLEYKIERLTDELADALAVNGALLGQFTHLSTQLAVCSTDDE